MSAPTTSLVSVLKKKMLDTKEEVEKVKEQIQDMTKKMEVFIIGNIGLFECFLSVKDEVGQRELAMSEATKLEEMLADLEENLAKKKEMAKEANNKTTDLGKENEEAVRVARVLKNKNNIEGGKVEALGKQLGQSVLIEKEAEAKYEEVISQG